MCTCAPPRRDLTAVLAVLCTHARVHVWNRICSLFDDVRVLIDNVDGSFCEEGHFRTADGSGCAPCPAGNACIGGRSPSPCDVGTYSLAGKPSCVACVGCDHCAPTTGVCECAVGWAGHDCSCNVDECGSGGDEACSSLNATCVDGSGTYSCACLDGSVPSVCGCGIAADDANSNGVADCLEGCPAGFTTNATTGACELPIVVCDVGFVLDGWSCTRDDCPDDPLKTSAGDCGCGVADTDSDGDGTADCNDDCASDAAKTSAGDCGCGVADTDSDGDGTADCNDGCASDINKVLPGVCGCGTSDADTDGDGTADCNDGCAYDAAKTSAGDCGCGIVEDQPCSTTTTATPTPGSVRIVVRLAGVNRASFNATAFRASAAAALGVLPSQIVIIAVSDMSRRLSTARRLVAVGVQVEFEILQHTVDAVRCCGVVSTLRGLK